MDVGLFRRYDTIPYGGYATLDYVDYSAGFEDLCDKMLDHVQCPQKNRCITGNAVLGNYSTWEGTCLCSSSPDTCAR